MSTQTITSAGTSLNQVPAAYRLVDKLDGWMDANDVLDYGGGRFDTFTDYLGQLGIRNWVYDPYNRHKVHNETVRKLLTMVPADVAICSNVLNVVRNPKIRQEILEDIRDLTKQGAPIFITVYEGNRTSRGKKTTRGWQVNRPLKNYLREVRDVFPNAQVKGKLIHAVNWC